MVTVTLIHSLICTIKLITLCISGCVVECRICNREVSGSNLGRGYFAPRSTQPSIPPWSVNEYQLQLGRQRQVWLIPVADERGCAGKTEIPWEHAPYLSTSVVVFHYEKVLYQVYAPLPLPYLTRANHHLCFQKYIISSVGRLLICCKQQNWQIMEDNPVLCISSSI